MKIIYIYQKVKFLLLVNIAMAEWEEEFEQVAEVKTEIKIVEIESEDIIKTKVEYVAPNKDKKDDPNDYEKKWEEKNKDLLERKKNNELAVEGLDEKDKQKKLIDKRIIDDVADFMDLGKPASKKESEIGEKVVQLVNEKDFIELAVQNVGRIKAANKPAKFTFSYLKNSIDLLAPTLDGDKLDQLIKDLTVLFNKKIKGNKKPTTTANVKPQVKIGLDRFERAEKMGVYDDFGVNDDVQNEEDYYEDDFI